MKKRLVALLVLALTIVLAFTSCDIIDKIKDMINPEPPVVEEQKEFAVYFLAGEGIGVPAQTVKSGELVTKPEDPYMEGFLFDGWYKDAELTEAWNFDTDTVTKNTIIYGKWVDHTHSGGTATCTEKAICEVCDHAYGSLLDHVGGTATCTAQAECEVCGTPYGQPLGHDVVVIEGKAPTCTETGLTDGAYCTRCDAKVEQEVIDALGHTPVVDEAVAPTCTETGLTEGSHCSTCETVLEAQEVIPATGHTWGEWIVDLEPTENAEGSKHRECACGERETVAIPALNHTHSYSPEVTTEAGCETDGVRTFTCSCGDSYTEAIPATGHTEGEVVVENEVAATCTAEGSHDNVVYCVECDAELSRETVTTDALGHKDENGDFKCDRECGKIVEPADGTALTIEQAEALASLFAHNTYTTNKYYVTCEIKNVYNTQYGNINIVGSDFVIYGLYSADGETRYDAMSYKPTTGDEITVYGVIGKYNSTLQMKNGRLDEVVAHEHDYSDATCEALATCSICGATTGELADHNYVDGTCSVCGKDENSTEPVETWTLVTDASQLVDGAEIVIVAAKYNFALGSQSGNYRNRVAIVKNADNTVTINDDVQIITIVIKDGKILLQVSAGQYLYAVGGSNNHLKTSSTINDAAKWDITISNGTASVKSNVDSTRNTLMYNSNSGQERFSCYAGTQQAVSIYIKTVNTPAECQHEGGKATCESPAICDLCGEEYGEALGHDMVTDEAVAPTCTATGLTEGSHCSRCDHKVAQEEVPALGHTEGAVVVENNDDPTCTTAGSYDTVVYCTVCEKELSRKTTTVNALGHAWGEWIEDTPATEEADGAKHRVCGTCGEVEEGVIPSIEHVHSYTPTVTDPTCTEQGYTTHTCRCGDSYVDTYVDALGHNGGEAVVEKDVKPTCTTAGSYDTVVYCTVCEVELSRTTVPVDALGHDYDEVVTDPTCTAKGYTTHTCSVCGDTYTDNEVDALDHAWDEGTVTKAATYGHAGTMKYTCTRDNTHTKTETIAKLVLAADATPAEIVDAAYSLAKDESLSNKQTLIGVITQINTAYDSGYKNVTVTIKVNGADATKTIQCYRMKGTGADKIGVGDTITVSGTIKNYSGTIEFDAGCTLDSYTIHECDWSEATCKAPKTCSICGKTDGELADHNYVDGVCTVCGVNKNQVVDTTAVAIKDYATANGWKDATKYTTLAVNEFVNATFAGKDNTGKYYTNGNNWRMYQTESATLTFSANEGVTIVSIKITYASEKNGVLTLNGAQIKSGTVVTVNANSVKFGIGNTGSATNGQVRITNIEVTYAYAASAPEHECEHVCPECGKCTDEECTESVCNDKCQGHHECEHVCEECGKCTDTECTESVCNEKCQGHHECEHICPECGKCTDTECTEDVCAEKCEGHHECEHVCEECGKCTDTECTEDVCAEKCICNRVVFSTTTTIDLSKTGVHFEGNTGTYEGLEIDATNGKFADNNGGWVQVNTGTVITLYVLDGAQVSVADYYNSANFTVEVVDGVCTITATANDYLKAITVKYAIVYNEATTIDLSKTGVHFEGNTGVYEGLEIDATNGKFADNNGGWVQVNAGTVITFNVFEGANVSVKSYSNNPDNFTITVVDGVCTITVVGNDYINTITIAEKCNCADVDPRDHKCDACGETLSECADVNPVDHECDTCGKALSECKDANSNHKCDICSDKMSDCADVDPRDHECDVCGLALTRCEDGEIKDHVCDICGDEVSKCKDDNKDHNCDVCGAVLSECDTDYRTHNCEYCGKKLTECVDNDNDHECDVCGLAISECKDANNNHKCDVCGDTMSKCADEDHNHYCDICGIQNSQCMDLPPYDHNCDWCGEKMSEHEEGTVVVENNVPADCENAGSYDNVVYCTVCGAELSRKTVPVSATGHTWGEWIEDTPAGEYEDGTKHRECDNCDATENGIIPALGHQHSYNATVTDPTCTEQGYTTHTCRCNDSYVDTYVDALGHDTVVDKAVDPTCTEDGLTEGSHCTRCDYKVTQDVVPATGHATEVEYWTYNNELYLVPVCGCLTEKVLVDTTNGVGVSNEADLVFLLTNGFDVKLEADIDLTETIDIMGSIATIDLNGKTLKADWESDGVVEVLHIHDGSHITIIGEGNVVSGGTYTAGTNSVISCRIYSELTIKGGNYYSASYGDVIFCETNSIVRIEGGHFEAAESYYGTWYVLDIDEEETNNRGQFVVTGGTFVNFDPANHTNDRDYTNKVADGYHSIGNDGVYTVSAHDYEYSIIQTAPTCTEDGYTTYTCICGDSYVDDEYETPGHSYNAVVTDPTCTTDGYTTYKCSVCGDTYVDNKVASKGHVKGDAVIEKEVKPTCETKGSYETAVYCTVCNAELDRTTAIVPKLGHTEGDVEVENEKAPTCTAAGSYDNVVYCTVCDAEISRETIPVNATGHNYKPSVTDPTCTTAGYTTYTCACGDNYTADEVVATGHSYSTPIVTPPTCTEGGYTTSTCTNCGDEKVTDETTKTGHAWGEWAYNNDNTHTRVCDNDATHTQTAYCDGGDATCSTLAKCDDCGSEYGDFAEHSLNASGVCVFGCGFKHIEGGWQLVTNANQLTVGSEIVILGKNTTYALSTNQKSNNRGAASVTKNGTTITFGDDVQVITLKSGSSNGTFAFYVTGSNTGYLYAASSSGNQLKTKSTLDVHGSWTITIQSDGTASIVAVGSSNRNVMQYNYNNGSPLFACYASASQTALQIYIKVAGYDCAPHAHVGGTATCENAAVCEICDEQYGTTVDHASTTPATCETAEVCMWCGEEINPALDHDMADATCTEPATCKREGCDHTEGEKLGHAWGDWIVTKPATEDEEGSQYRVCSRCDDEEVDIIPTLDHVHSYTSEVTTEAGCETAGVRTFTCTCGDSYEEEIIATGHTWDTIVVVDPTCTANGYTSHTCHCGNTYNDTEVPSSGHKDENNDYKCEVCSKVAEPEANTTLTIEQAIALAKAAGASYTTNKYYVSGRIISIANTTYGNMTIRDENGKDLYIYGLNSADGNTRYDAMSTKPAVHDEITIYTVLGTYNNSVQAKEAWLDKLVAHECSEFSDPTCISAALCVICNEANGSALGHTTESGTCDRCGETIGGSAEPTWQLVTDVNTLKAGDQIIIVASGSNYALGTTQNTNNRNSVAVTKSSDKKTITNISSTVQILTLKAGKTSGTWSFYTGSGYLYSASSSKNYLKTESSLSANSSWNITITSAGVATIKSTGSNTRNWLRFNSSNNPPLFSSYGSGQADVSIYVLR